VRGGGGRLPGRAGGGLVGRGRAAVRGAGVTLHRQLQLHEYLNTQNKLSISVADPDPGSGMGGKSASGSGIRDEQPGSYFLELRNHFFGFLGVKILKFFDADPGSGIETLLSTEL
jgi:hypothetical protein